MAVYQYVKHADQLPKPWVGIGQSTGGQSGCITCLSMQKKTRPNRR